ncbi:MAG TPA: class I SAM-dependent methyltransferase [Chloroflexaceae bacterium]|nr:class I SAM-dependent methyltransferase [Chloroflexaceae bacterium]
MATHELDRALDSIAGRAALFEEGNFALRAKALDDLEFHLIGRLDGLLAASPASSELARLRERAERAREQLERVNLRLFERLRAEIRAGALRGPAFSRLLSLYLPRRTLGGARSAAGYDNLDLFVNGLLHPHGAPTTTTVSHPEMVGYQPTPARVIFELASRARPGARDLFYDLGSGLGNVALLVHLLSGAPARGVELEAAYCDHAASVARGLNLGRVEFIRADARAVDCADGSIFFMYTPCRGAMLQQVLDNLRRAARGRNISLFTYGPCTPVVARQDWLAGEGQRAWSTERLAAFRSL